MVLRVQRTLGSSVSQFIEGSQGKNFSGIPKARTEAEECHLLTFSLWFVQSAFLHHPWLPARAGTVLSKLGLFSSSILIQGKRPHRPVYRPIWWRSFLIEIPFLYICLGLWQVGNKKQPAFSVDQIFITNYKKAMEHDDLRVVSWNEPFLHQAVRNTN